MIRVQHHGRIYDKNRDGQGQRTWEQTKLDRKPIYGPRPRKLIENQLLSDVGKVDNVGKVSDVRKVFLRGNGRGGN